MLDWIRFLLQHKSDQCEPVLIYSILSKNNDFIIKFVKGIVLKLGFFGNNLEHIILKPTL